ncbi:MAG: helix-turn-helix domain-containing protein [Chloroflexi bacterium]|nr:helix-turn-helix domain-containing protein [Chloroflexota bacterium]
MLDIDKRDYYTVAEVAEMLCVTPPTVQRWIRECILYAFYVGQHDPRVLKEDVEALRRTLVRNGAQLKDTAKATSDAENTTDQGSNTDIANDGWVSRPPASPEEIAGLMEGYDSELVGETISRLSGSIPKDEGEAMIAYIYSARRQSAR